MLVVLLVAALLFALWIAINLKTSRPDGVLIKKVHPYRLMLGHIMPRRADAQVYFDVWARADKIQAYVDAARQRFPVDLTHVLVAAAGLGLMTNPRMNRFVVGRRLYQRNETTVTFSAKRKRKDRKAKLTAIKHSFREGETFADFCQHINAQLATERSDKVTSTDREMNLLTRIPRPLMVRAVRIAQWLDYHNLLPAAFIKAEGMYCSAFVANLGSLGMDPGYHHLYEWGTCPIFIMIGKITEMGVVEDGQMVIRKMLHLRYSFDERVDDAINCRSGFDGVNKAIEDPFTYLGCLAEDGSDAMPLLERGRLMCAEADRLDADER